MAIDPDDIRKSLNQANVAILEFSGDTSESSALFARWGCGPGGL